jgi:NitT/TauT family transport system ATP-binding protein
VKDVLQLVNLEGFREEVPLAAVGRHAAARLHRPRARLRPDMLLMDEPFGALDEIVRDHLNEQLLALWADEKDRRLRHPLDPRGGVPVDQDRGDEPAPGPHLRDHRLQIWATERSLDVRETPEFLKIAHQVREGLKAGHSL